MGEELALNVGADAIRVMIYLAGPMLVGAMVIGIVVSVLQAITQINEATLTFIPKMLVIIGILALMGPWMLETMKDYTIKVITEAGENIR